MFIGYLKQRFLHSTHVQSMGDIDSYMNSGAQAHVHQHIQVMSALIRLPAGLFYMIVNYQLCSPKFTDYGTKDEYKML